MSKTNQPEIEARKGIDFGLDENLPKYWHSNDPFKTRLHDALQSTFPEGERYFISSVRAFRDQITDPKLQHEVKEFTMQEAQHGIAHTVFNELLEKQGMPMARLLAEHKNKTKEDEARWTPEYNLAITAAAEHFTALLADTYFSNKETTAGMHPKMRALFAWHAIEEMEHRSVAFDVMQKVAKVGYWTRAKAMVRATWIISYFMFHFADEMLKADGFSKWQRRKMFVKNIPWMYGPRKGILSSFTPNLLRYFKPNFHPEDIPVVHNYGQWVEVYDDTGNPHQACDAMIAAAY